MWAAFTILAVGSALTWLVAKKQRELLRSWQTAAESCGLQVTEVTSGLRPSIRARDGLGVLSIEPFGSNDQDHTFRIEANVSGPPDLQQVKIRPQAGSDAREIAIGDVAFDTEFFIQGPVLLVYALLEEENRRLLSLLNTLGRTELSAGELRTQVIAASVPSALSTLLHLRIRLAEPLDIPRRLAENAGKDPVPRVRLHNLLLLLRELPGNPVTAEALRAAVSDPSPEVRLRVAEELGPEGRGILLQLAEEPEDDAVSAEALSALARELPLERKQAILQRALARRRLRTVRACLRAIGHSQDPAAPGVLAKVMEEEYGELAPAAAEALELTGSPAAEAPLLQALQRDQADLRVAAAKALGRVGSAAAVLPLKEAAERSRLDLELRQATRQAIAEIQSRVQGASPGQLSLAGMETGQLSLADDPAGRLSLGGEEDEG